MMSKEFLQFYFRIRTITHGYILHLRMLINVGLHKTYLRNLEWGIACKILTEFCVKYDVKLIVTVNNNNNNRQFACFISALVNLIIHCTISFCIIFRHKNYIVYLKLGCTIIILLYGKEHCLSPSGNSPLKTLVQT